MNGELPDVQAGFRKGRGTRDQIASICWIIEKAREFQKNIYFCFTDYAKAFDCMDHNKLKNSSRDGNIRPPDLPPEKSVCRSRRNSQNWTWNNGQVPNCERSTSRLYIVTLLEAQAGIKIAGKNINKLRYADDTILIAESEEELNSLLIKVKKLA